MRPPDPVSPFIASPGCVGQQAQRPKRVPRLIATISAERIPQLRQKPGCSADHADVHSCHHDRQRTTHETCEQVVDIAGFIYIDEESATLIFVFSLPGTPHNALQD